MLIGVLTALAVGVVVIVVAWLVYSSLAFKHLPPLVVGVPILGNALSYLRDPKAFLIANSRKHNGVFTVNMAGRVMVILAEPLALSSFFRASDLQLGSRQAVADVGFSETLGYMNVWAGPALLTHYLNHIYYPRFTELPHRRAIVNAVTSAVRREIGGVTSGIFEAFTFTRRGNLQYITTCVFEH